MTDKPQTTSETNTVTLEVKPDCIMIDAMWFIIVAMAAGIALAYKVADCLGMLR